MNLITKLQIMALLPVVLLFLTGTVYFVTDKHVKANNEKAMLADDMVKAASELALLAFEHGVSYDERPRTQLRQTHTSIGDLLKKAGQKFTEDNEKDLFDLIERSHKTIGHIFTDIESSVTSSSVKISRERKEYLDRLHRRLLIEAQSIIPRADKLHDINHEDAQRHSKTQAILNIIFFISLVLTIPAIALFMIKGIAAPLARLQNGMKNVSNGGIDQPVPVTTHDELGRLTESFNSMAFKLKESQKELQRTNESLERQVGLRTAELLEANEQLSGEIREREFVVDALRLSETKYRIVADNTYDWEFWLSPEGRFLYNSPSCEKISGYSVKDFESDPDLLLNIVHTEDTALFEGHRHHVVQDETSEELEFRIIHRNGHELWLAHVCQPVHDDTGKFLGTRGSNRDITERKLSEAVLRESRKTILALINAITESVLLIEPDGTVIMLNETTAKRFGRTWEAMMGTNIYDFLPPDIASARREKLQQVVEAGKPVNFEDVRSGRNILNSIYPLLDERGKVTRLAIFGYDITEQRKADEKLKMYAEALEKSNRELEQFAYVASHDLQEPLRKIASFTELLSKKYRGQMDDKADTFIEYIVDGSNRMRTLINDLLSYSRVMTKGKEFAEIDCNVVIDRVLKDLEFTIKEQKAEIALDKLPAIMADDIQIGQLFQNLIGNAIKYHGEETPKVHISAQKEGTGWKFAVRDNGIGIDPGQAERIFLIFQRLHTRAEYSGTGIGLAICKKIVERHGGRIWVESGPGKGSTFYFTIPENKTTGSTEVRNVL